MDADIVIIPFRIHIDVETAVVTDIAAGDISGAEARMLPERDGRLETDGVRSGRRTDTQVVQEIAGLRLESGSGQRECGKE